MDRIRIETAARDLLNAMYRQRSVLWPGENRPPHEMMEPPEAARFLGAEFRLYDELGGFGNRGSRFETAGMLDRRRAIIAVATKFPPEVVRFTGAHEVAHWLLHPGEVMHRDRPVKGLTADAGRRSSIEAEADYFAACFLMPERLVSEAVERAFKQRLPLLIDDVVAFHLRGNRANYLLQADSESLEREFAVASCEHFNGRSFYSLAKQFRVSIMSMAIRLRELKLVQV
jgi:Zn-dependent peptidase ImmA (M78 family)